MLCFLFLLKYYLIIVYYNEHRKVLTPPVWHHQTLMVSSGAPGVTAHIHDTEIKGGKESMRGEKKQ